MTNEYRVIVKKSIKLRRVKPKSIVLVQKLDELLHERIRIKALSFLFLILLSD